jgi:selenide,water dikinase
VTEEELILLADAQTSGGLLVVGEVHGAPVVGETVVAGSLGGGVLVAVS